MSMDLGDEFPSTFCVIWHVTDTDTPSSGVLPLSTYFHATPSLFYIFPCIWVIEGPIMRALRLLKAFTCVVGLVEG
jgi:hypothetical protein